MIEYKNEKDVSSNPRFSEAKEQNLADMNLKLIYKMLAPNITRKLRVTHTQFLMKIFTNMASYENNKQLDIYHIFIENTHAHNNHLGYYPAVTRTFRTINTTLNKLNILKNAKSRKEYQELKETIKEYKLAIDGLFYATILKIWLEYDIFKQDQKTIKVIKNKIEYLNKKLSKKNIGFPNIDSNNINDSINKCSTQCTDILAKVKSSLDTFLTSNESDNNSYRQVIQNYQSDKLKEAMHRYNLDIQSLDINPLAEDLTVHLYIVAKSPYRILSLINNAHGTNSKLFQVVYNSVHKNNITTLSAYNTMIARSQNRKEKQELEQLCKKEKISPEQLITSVFNLIHIEHHQEYNKLILLSDGERFLKSFCNHHLIEAQIFNDYQNEYEKLDYFRLQYILTGNEIYLLSFKKQANAMYSQYAKFILAITTLARNIDDNFEQQILNHEEEKKYKELVSNIKSKIFGKVAFVYNNKKLTRESMIKEVSQLIDDYNTSFTHEFEIENSVLAYGYVPELNEYIIECDIKEQIDLELGFLNYIFNKNQMEKAHKSLKKEKSENAHEFLPTIIFNLNINTTLHTNPLRKFDLETLIPIENWIINFNLQEESEIYDCIFSDFDIIYTSKIKLYYENINSIISRTNETYDLMLGAKSLYEIEIWGEELDFNQINFGKNNSTANIETLDLHEVKFKSGKQEFNNNLSIQILRINNTNLSPLLKNKQLLESLFKSLTSCKKNSFGTSITLYWKKGNTKDLNNAKKLYFLLRKYCEYNKVLNIPRVEIICGDLTLSNQRNSNKESDLDNLFNRYNKKPFYKVW